MSHFTVLVVCPADTIQSNVHERLEEALAPFVEQVDSSSEYAVFHDMVEECRSEYENGASKRIVMPDGRLLLPWDEEFRKEGSIGMGSGTHNPPAELEKRMVPYKEIYPTLSEFITDWRGYNFYESEGAYGYYYNPNAKWDWWTLGGRWQGLLTAKTGTPPRHLIYGEPGVFDPSGDEYTRSDGRIGCDGCRKGDLDFDWTREQKILSVRTHWEHMIAQGDEKNADMRQFKYGFDMDSSLEDELRKAKLYHPFDTFAVIKDGEWFEEGEMGSFAHVANRKSTGEWYSELQWLWDEISDDHVVVVVDCHI